MNNDDRRADDARIEDIRQTLHGIDVRVTRVEAKEEGLEHASAENYAHLDRRIDTLQSSLQTSVENVHTDVLQNRSDFKRHIEQEDADRKAIVSRLTLMLWTLVIALGGWGLSKLTEGTPL